MTTHALVGLILARGRLTLSKQNGRIRATTKGKTVRRKGLQLALAELWKVLNG